MLLAYVLLCCLWCVLSCVVLGECGISCCLRCVLSCVVLACVVSQVSYLLGVVYPMCCVILGVCYLRLSCLVWCVGVCVPVLAVPGKNKNPNLRSWGIKHIEKPTKQLPAAPPPPPPLPSKNKKIQLSGADFVIIMLR